MRCLTTSVPCSLDSPAACVDLLFHGSKLKNPDMCNPTSLPLP